MTNTGLKLGIFGAGGHAKVVADTAWRTASYVPIAFYDDDTARHHTEHYRGVKIRGNFDQLLQDLKSNTLDVAFIAIGNNQIRVTRGEHVLKAGFSLATLVDPHAILSPTVKLGMGTLVVAGAIINADTCIGSHVIINTGARVDHDCVIEDGVHIAPSATLCGAVQIGERTLIGVGATLLPSTQFPANSILGGGSVVTRPLHTPGNYVGCPAKILTKC